VADFIIKPVFNACTEVTTTWYRCENCRQYWATRWWKSSHDMFSCFSTADRWTSRITTLYTAHAASSNTTKQLGL